jgi:hypothetical protein
MLFHYLSIAAQGLTITCNSFTFCGAGKMKISIRVLKFRNNLKQLAL